MLSAPKNDFIFNNQSVSYDNKKLIHHKFLRKTNKSNFLHIIYEFKTIALFKLFKFLLRMIFIFILKSNSEIFLPNLYYKPNYNNFLTFVSNIFYFHTFIRHSEIIFKISVLGRLHFSYNYTCILISFTYV